MRILLPFTVALLLLGGAAPAQDKPGTTLVVASSDEYGPYITKANGRPVYAFLTDQDIGGDGLAPRYSCDTPCREVWPLVLATGEIRISEALDPELVTTRMLEENRVLAYNGYTLFLFNRDTPFSGPQGQGIFSYGGYWALLRPSGSPIRSGPMNEVEILPELRDN